jgi:membrane-associated PAP2 superfamily phosphatase
MDLKRGRATVDLVQGRVGLGCRHARDVCRVSDLLFIEEIRDLSVVEVMSMLGGTNCDWI